MSDAPKGLLPPEPATGRVYRQDVLIRFAYCDPAGIVFFPRYLELCNNLIEDWSRDELGFSFAEIHKGHGWGLPTVHLDVNFFAPSFIGEVLAASLSVRKVGTSSFGVTILFRGPDNMDRVRTLATLVLTDPITRRAMKIPDHLKARIQAFHASS